MSGLEDASEELLKLTDRTLPPQAVYSQIGIMSFISIVTILLFNVLRPKNKIIYEPKVKYHVGAKPPPRISDSLFGWLPPLIHTKEPELVEKVGLDAVTFLRFLRMMRSLFTCIALLVCVGLLPVNIAYNLKNEDAKHDTLSMLTIRNVQGLPLFAHVAATYIITIMICVFVYLHWRAMVKLRNDWFRSPEFLESFYARTLAILHVPKKYQTDEGIKAILDGIKAPYPTTSVHIGRRVGKLPELVEYHNEAVRELEGVLVKYLKGGRIGKKRPSVRIGGFLGIGGTTYDAIDYYTAKLKRTEAAIEEYRSQIDTHKAESYGFASMAAVPYAHIVAKMLAGKHPHGTDIDLAPNPKDIIWDNMNMTDAARTSKRLNGFFWLVVVCFFNTIPLLIISLLANLTVLTAYVPFLDSWQTSSPNSFAVVSGVLPPAVSALFGFFLPIIMRWLSQYMGDLTYSKLDRSVVSHYFAFLIASQLIIFTLFGVFFNLIRGVVDSVGKKSFLNILKDFTSDNLPDKIHQSYIDQSSYWLTFFPLRGFLVLFDLAQIINLLWVSFKTRVFGRTPRDIREWTQPPEFQYAIYYSNILFMGAVGLIFAPLAPIVTVAAAVVMWLSSWVYKYQLMFVFVSRVETGGRLWNVVINRLLFVVVLMQLIMILTIGLSFSFKTFEWVAAIPPVFIMVAFKVYVSRTFIPSFKFYVPTQEELQNAKIHSERGDNRGNRLGKRFGHPALHAELFTPMLHAKMMPLLAQVYQGKIGTGKTKLDEYNGQKMEAHIIEGGLKIAAIEQSDLERPDLYGRDRGELDWDARSIASTTVFNDSASTLQASKSQYFAHSNGSVGNGKFSYERYLASGPGHQTNASDIELTRMDSMNEPLLSPRSQQFYQQQQSTSQLSMAPSYQDPSSNGSMRSAPLHRPGTTAPPDLPTYATQQTFTESPRGTPYSTPPQQHQQLPSRHQTPAPTSTHRQQGSWGNTLDRSASPAHRQQGSLGNTLDRSASPAHRQQGSWGNPLDRSVSPGPQQSYGAGGGGGGNMAGRGAHRM